MHNFLLISLFVSIISSAYASFPSLFGTNFSTASIGNQADHRVSNSGNIYYLPALIAFSKKRSFSANFFYTLPQFKSIDNVVLQNSATSGKDPAIRGNVDTDYGAYLGNSIGLIFPLKKGVIGLNLTAPLDGTLLEMDTGLSYAPEYVMYRDRFKRLETFIHYAYPLRKDLALSLGIHTGYQIGMRMEALFSSGSEGAGSSTTIRVETKMPIALNFSLVYKMKDTNLYFSFDQEMKSKLEAELEGEIFAGANVVFANKLDSLKYFDPHTFRFGLQRKIFDNLWAYGSLDYQIWENFEAPIVKITYTREEGGGIRGSDNFRQLDLQNIFQLKLGTSLLQSKYNYSLGLIYKPSPLKGDFSSAGNTIDTDTIVFTGGVSWKLNQKTMVGTSLQYHHLLSQSVTKSAGQEDGNTGEKVGAPGYEIGGGLISASVGLSFVF